jgi:hypothetical protein
MGVVKVWDLRVFAPLQTIETEYRVRAAAFDTKRQTLNILGLRVRCNSCGPLWA